MSVKRLNNDLLLAKGNERFCYIHPDDAGKVIKVTYKHEGGRSQNILEANYYECLKKKGIPLDHIVTCYGWTEIDGEKGLVFERVQDFDGKTSLTLNEVIREKLLPIKEVKEKLEGLQYYLERYNIVFVDSSFDNIMCQRSQEGDYTLKIIDGLGGRRLGLKSRLYCVLPFYARYKVRHQWQKILHNLDISLANNG